MRSKETERKRQKDKKREKERERERDAERAPGCMTGLQQSNAFAVFRLLVAFGVEGWGAEGLGFVFGGYGPQWGPFFGGGRGGGLGLGGSYIIRFPGLLHVILLVLRQLEIELHAYVYIYTCT